MLLRIYSVHDGAVGAFMTPFFERSDASASRAFSAAIMDEKHAMSRFPSDYVLHFVGIFDDSSGRVSCDDASQVLLRGVDVAKAK
ncbi:MAG: nonstructural protein [Microvirus sp.]|nr:MAG: nonstructural protein [Microvirus sp.]